MTWNFKMKNLHVMCLPTNRSGRFYAETYKELLNILGDFDILELEIINEIQKK